MKKLLAVSAALVALTVFAAPPKAKAPEAAPAAAKFTITGDPAKGQVKFKELCSACHGELGKGDGPASAALTPKPANFADAAHAASVTDEYIYNMIKEGGAANGKSAMMAPWKASLNEAQLMDVAAYVRSLSKSAAPAAAPAADKKAPTKK
ncbi:MAG: cytochrome c [Myxococcus sp.]|nr:cytochrome c [Myxococcus sp.]